MTADPIEAVRAALDRPGRDTSDFDLNPEASPGVGNPPRPAAVLVPLWRCAEGVRVILTKRSSRLRHHPGQIAFPGGKIDAGDDGPVAAALREAEEEIALDRGRVHLLGVMAPHRTVTGFSVTPVVAAVEESFVPRPEIGEVDEVFAVPLAHLMAPANYRVEGRIWLGQRRQYYTVPYGPYYIWGATARILRALADRMGG